MQRRSFLLLCSKKTFITTLLVATATIIAVWFVGLRQEWTLFRDSLVAATILTASFSSFLTVSLYVGVKLRDTLGPIATRQRLLALPENLPDVDLADLDFDAGEGAGILMAILFWLLAAVVAVALLWMFAAIAWAAFVICAAILYWIFFRALRLVFRHSAWCKGHLLRSLRYSLTYTALYLGWLYGIILLLHYLR
ncbi:hypothetical protein LGH70_17145 [Hymenobacter sp. BT635]|uniref:Ubiquinone biosynthesis protein UbiA n=1 Tax=Hymenobacter nitidus TaxID=2880929 RepID=A0ABS8AH85_9BACT|nr:hypothetical protein [Hymenobacter nitidus]MCB2379327.1 hypothetical protein [Hymenobacter nitidus]